MCKETSVPGVISFFMKALRPKGGVFFIFVKMVSGLKVTEKYVILKQTGERYNNMKKNRINIIVSVLIVAAIVALVAFYAYDVVYNGTPVAENLFRTLAVVFLLLGSLVRVWNSRVRKSLDTYEKAYKEEIGQAFQNKAFARKKLLCAARLYNESNYEKALKYLSELYKEAEIQRDVIPVLFFSALCYTELGLMDDAISVYYKLLELDERNSTTHSNLGLLLVKYGDFDTALKHFDKAINCDPYNYHAYLNRASCFFRKGEYNDAVTDAEKALEIKNNGLEAASLLAIIYALKGDEEKRKKYFHLSIASGENPEKLKEAIKYYMQENNTEEKDEEIK